MARIQTTRMVKIALWAIRIYLLILLSLIGLKFTQVFRNAHMQAPPVAAPVQTAGMSNAPPSLK